MHNNRGNNVKIAISGKGGVGKSTISAALSLLLAEQGKRVLAVDADPDANLAAALGFALEDQNAIVPISKQVELIEERTGAKVDQYGQIFTLNPDVADIAGTYASVHNGVSLLVLGAVKRGGGGCACPENVLIRALVADLILNKDDVLVMDMEAGLEHLGRATTSGVDTMIVVVEPGHRSVEGAKRIIEMANQIKVKDIRFVANKIDGPEDEAFVKESLPDQNIMEFIPFARSLRKVDRPGVSVLEGIEDEIKEKFTNILSALNH
ncbi:MAG: AAA family ATPase [Spirochaetales bacterium]|nr:AAA family ATPase [Spirochaetales bacterium]